jgi:hypothetical protein
MLMTKHPVKNDSSLDKDNLNNSEKVNLTWNHWMCIKKKFLFSFYFFEIIEFFI